MKTEKPFRITLKMRALALVAMLVTAAILFSYLYVVQRHRPSLRNKVKSVFLKTKGGQQSLVDKEIAMSPRQHDVTIVTAYFNIGSFIKGNGNSVFSSKLYRDWVKIFHRIRNPVIAFFDDERDAKMFQIIRNTLPKNMTRVYLVDRDELWAFSLRPKIDKLFRQPNYPHHSPNTINADYSCVMHAKYEVMSKALVENPFKTRYFSWLDVGLFRAEVHKKGPPFSIVLPPKFDANKIAYTEVNKMAELPITAKQIVVGNFVWVCGCFFIGRHDVMARWVEQYKSFTLKMLETRWMSTDQQVLYYMYQSQNKVLPIFDVEIQTYKKSAGKLNEWFYLGYICMKKENQKKIKKITGKTN